MLEETNYKGYAITLEQDPWPENPLSWTTPTERGATFVLFHRQYGLPNELGVDFDEYENWREVARENFPEDQRDYRFVRWYEHSGIAVSLSDTPDVGGWDSGCVGVIFGENGQTIENAFEDWRCYIEGDIWRYSVTDKYGDEIETNGGCFGYNYAVAEAKEFIDTYKAPRESSRALNAGRLHV